MRIKTLSDKTGISRRNIHFYLQQGFLTPEVNSANGYYNFTSKDIMRLNIIKKLRDAGFSLSSIRSIINTPEAIEYYLRMRLNHIRQEREKSFKIEEDIAEILSQISVNPTLQETENLILDGMRTVEDAPPPYDSYLVNHFLWRGYHIDGSMTDYQEFLREKIYRMTNTREKNLDYALLNDFLVTEDQKRIDALYAERISRYRVVAAMNDDEILEYADQMKENIKIFLDSPNLIFYWKQNMRDFYWPMIRIYTTEIGKIAEEMLPLFKMYKSKSQAACKIVYEWLHTSEGEYTLLLMRDRLGDLLDIDNYDHAVLESINLALVK